MAAHAWYCSKRWQDNMLFILACDFGIMLDRTIEGLCFVLVLRYTPCHTYCVIEVLLDSTLEYRWHVKVSFENSVDQYAEAFAPCFACPLGAWRKTSYLKDTLWNDPANI